MFLIFFNYNSINSNIQNIVFSLVKNFLAKTSFLMSYYVLNELIWQEGFLIDFTQKKFTDNWIKTFLIYSSYLFNERLVFDKVVKFYLNLIIWPLHKLFIFEINNVANILFITVFLFFFFFLLFSLLFFLLLFSPV